MKELFDILSADMLRSIMNNKCLKIKQLNSLVSLLIKSNIQFSLTYVPATSTEDAKTTMVIYVNPNVSVTIHFDMDSGSVFMD